MSPSLLAKTVSISALVRSILLWAMWWEIFTSDLRRRYTAEEMAERVHRVPVCGTLLLRDEYQNLYDAIAP